MRGKKRSFQIKTVAPVFDTPLTAEEIPRESLHCTIVYSDSMTYKGEIHGYKAHGFGTLIEPNKTSIGWWMQGIFQNGIVMHLKPIPHKMKQEMNFPQIQEAVLVLEQHAVNPTTKVI